MIGSIGVISCEIGLNEREYERLCDRRSERLCDM